MHCKEEIAAAKRKVCRELGMSHRVTKFYCCGFGDLVLFGLEHLFAIEAEFVTAHTITEYSPKWL